MLTVSAACGCVMAEKPSEQELYALANNYLPGKKQLLYSDLNQAEMVHLF